MVENKSGECAKRCRGRPQVRSDDETLAIILEAAGQEFQDKGYEATSVAAVAERAGVSTKTVYRLVPTKADLFSSVITGRINRFVAALDLGAVDTLDAQAAIAQMLTLYGILTLEPRTVAMTRLVLGECRAFREVGDAFYQGAIVRSSEAMAAVLRRLVDRGLIEIDDLAEAVGLLRGMMIFDPQRAAMLGKREAPTAEEIAQRAERCARVFLEGCAARQT